MPDLRRLFTLSPDNEPFWVRLYVHRIEDMWAAMPVGGDVPPSESGTLKRIAIIRMMPDEAEWKAEMYLGYSDSRD